MKNNFITALCMASFLSGCTMIPTIEMPKFSAANKWDDIPAYNFSTEDGLVSDMGWETFFMSDDIRSIVRIAIDNNKDLKIAALKIEEARALYRINRSDLLPHMNANSGAAVQKTSDESSPTGYAQKSENYSANISVPAYELDLFGRIQSENIAAFNDYESIKQSRAIVQNALIGETANAYMQYLADKKILKLTKQTLDAQNEIHGLVKLSFDNGVANELDLAGSRTAVELAQANYYQYQRLVEQDKNALFLLMGVANDDSLLPNSSLDDVKVKKNLDPSIPSQVLLSRPDVKQAEFELLSANADIGAARSAFFPSISLTGNLGFASQDLGNLFTSSAGGVWSFIPQISLPIFRAGANKDNLELAEIRKNIAIVNYESAIQSAFKDVANELDARQSLDNQLKAQHRLVQSAQKIYDLTLIRYKSGIDDFIDVLNAQKDLYGYQQTQIQIEQAALSNLVNIYKTLGGGLKSDF